MLQGFAQVRLENLHWIYRERILSFNAFHMPYEKGASWIKYRMPWGAIRIPEISV